ncbi:hypothetical protein ACEWY4_013912 [Coilia grayii]|uniref:BESS domain-containing protein n=1 Tax=Coilia grayii TaxID=363190 RepID=A0ABD1JXR0_9TELE
MLTSAGLTNSGELYLIYYLLVPYTHFATEDVCKKKWKGLRDTFKKEQNKERDRCRSGAGLGECRPWRFFAIMGFLAPFLESRETSGNFSQLRTEVRQMGPPAHPPSPQATNDVDQGSSQAGESASPSPLKQASDPPCTPPGPPPKRQRKERLTSFEERMLSAVEGLPRQSAPPDEDDLFFQGLMPILKRLPPRKKSQLKFKFHQMVYEAEMEAMERQSQSYLFIISSYLLTVIYLYS